MPISIHSWNQVIDDAHEVMVASGPCLEYRHPCRRVGNEDVQESVALSADEFGCFPSDIEDTPIRSGVDC
jgi:hypothetical protein